MRINHNIPALKTVLAARSNEKLLNTSNIRLSTGVKINSAKDDAAGLAIANKLRYIASGLDIAGQNATDGISLIQSSEGALDEIHSMLQRMRELTVQAANGSKTIEDKKSCQAEIDQLVSELSDSINRTEFNKIKILSGELAHLGFSSTVPPSTSSEANKIAKSTFISDSMPPGNLSYTIVKTGTPTQAVMGTITDATSSGIIKFNGVELAISEGEKAASIIEKITKAAEETGYYALKTTSGGLLISAKVYGSDQTLTIEGAGSSVGVSSTSGVIQGTDAEVTINDFLDSNNVSDPNFMNGSTVVTRGNTVTISSTNKQSVTIELQTKIDSDGNIYFRDSNNTAYDASVDMTLKIEDYGPLVLQIGANYNMGVEFQIPRMSGETLGLAMQNFQTKNGAYESKINVCTYENAQVALEAVSKAISMVSEVRSKLGAYQNRLESAARNLEVNSMNTTSALSRIEDTDMAREMTTYTQAQVLGQAQTAILAQANQRPQQILSLLN